VNPEVVTLVTHHPDRARRCLVRAIRSLRRATNRRQVVDLRVQGGGARAEKAVAAAQEAAESLEVHATVYGRNMRPVVPRVDSVAFLGTTTAGWWTKLDDDGEFPPGAIDHLIGAIQATEAPAGCAMAQTGRALPKMLVVDGTVVRCKKGLSSFGGGEWAQWRVCELVGDGCTVFRREVFDLCHWDARFEVSADLDMAMQMKRAGYVSLLCDPPRAGHFHKECSPKRYERVRYDHEAVKRSAKAFRDKWGMRSSYLENVKPRSFLR